MDSAKLSDYGEFVFRVILIALLLLVISVSRNGSKEKSVEQEAKSYKEICFGNSESEIVSLLSIRNNISIDYLPSDIQVQPTKQIQPISEESGGTGHCFLDVLYVLNGDDSGW